MPDRQSATYLSVQLVIHQGQNIVLLIYYVSSDLRQVPFIQCECRNVNHCV